MLLRGSGEHDGIDYDLDAIIGQGATGDVAPVAHAALLSAYAEAFYESEGGLASVRGRIADEMGPGCLIDAAATVAIFDAVVKIADATGIPLEDAKAEISEDIRGSLGIDQFPSAGSKTGAG